MVLNIRKIGEVADGSITSEKLASGSVVEGKIASGAVVSGTIAEGVVSDFELADNSVIESKIAELSISTDKLKDNVITLAKADDDIKLNTFIGDETEVNVTGIVEEAVKGLNFPKKLGHFYPKVMRFLATLKTSTVDVPATMNLYIDEESLPRISVSSSATTYEMKSAECDVSDLSAGKHYIELRLVSSGISDIAYNDMIDVMLIR